MPTVFAQGAVKPLPVRSVMNAMAEAMQQAIRLPLLQDLLKLSSKLQPVQAILSKAGIKPLPCPELRFPLLPQNTQVI